MNRVGGEEYDGTFYYLLIASELGLAPLADRYIVPFYYLLIASEATPEPRTRRPCPFLLSLDCFAAPFIVFEPPKPIVTFYYLLIASHSPQASYEASPPVEAFYYLLIASAPPWTSGTRRPPSFLLSLDCFFGVEKRVTARALIDTLSTIS